MEQQGIFKIAEPCHEDWSNMTSETQGRFCAACKRCVVDFTSKSHSEMKSIYDAADGDICGRVRVSQVAAPRSAIRTRINRFKAGALKGIQLFALALMLAFTSLFHSSVAAQKPVIMGKMAFNPSRIAEVEVTGRVVSEISRIPSSGIEVQLLQDGVALTFTQTDAKGNYQFQHVPSGEYEVRASNGDEIGSIFIRQEGKNLAHQDIQLFEMRVMGGLRYEPEVRFDTLPPVELIQPNDQIQPLKLDNSTDEMVEPIHPLMDAPVEWNMVSDLNTKTLAPVEIILLDDFTLKAFPNPTTDKVTLVAAHFGESTLDVRLFDIDGKVVYQSIWLPSNELHKVIALQALPAGIYLLQVTNGDKSIRRQLLKM